MALLVHQKQINVNVLSEKKRNELNVMQSIANSKETIKIPGIPISCVFLGLIELNIENKKASLKSLNECKLLNSHSLG